MFIIVIQCKELRVQSISNPRQFYVHSSDAPQMNILTRVKNIGLRGFIFILIVSSRILSNFIFVLLQKFNNLITKYRVCQQKQMFDYNRQQNFIEGVFRPRNLNIEGNNSKIGKQFELGDTNSPTFIKKIQFKNTKVYPFLEIEQQQKAKPEFVNELDFSIIQLKSPSYSEIYNSLGQQKFFPSTHEFSKKLDITENDTKFFNKGQEMNLNSAVKAEKQLRQIPTFFIKMPEHFKGQKMSEKKEYRKKLQEDLNHELEDIYNGKYKIEWKPDSERY